MTLAPIVNPSVHGVKGSPGILGFWCQAPGCTRPGQQRHHIWPRSFLRGQPNEWVSVDDVLVQNSCGLCISHHQEVTGDVGGHVAHIRWNEGLKILEWWETDDTEWVCLGPLKDQDVDAPFITVQAQTERMKEGLCPTCGKADRVKPKALPKRKAKSWLVSVPDDAEDGAAVLDEMVDDLSASMGWGDESKGIRRYHVLANALYWVIQMKPEFLAEWEEGASVP